MKVSFLWRSLAFMFLGFAFGVLLTATLFINNIPPTTEVSIGKVKIRGQGNTIEGTLNVASDTIKKRRFRRKR